jgi:hypothetical protein
VGSGTRPVQTQLLLKNHRLNNSNSRTDSITGDNWNIRGYQHTAGTPESMDTLCLKTNLKVVFLNNFLLCKNFFGA